MSYWKGAVVSLLTGVMIASSAIQPVAIYAETVLDEGGQADSAQDGSVQADGSESDRSTSDEPVDSESEASQDADEAPGSASIEMGEGAASTDGLAVAQDDASEAEESVAAEDASEANTMASRTLVENSWRYQNGQRIESLDDESAPSGDFLSRAMDPLPDGATAQGIDVSEFQGKIDWEAVKAAGVDFAILRIGYGDQNAGGTDKYFKRNVEECERLGIKWGAYLYSYSVNTKEAADEAAHVLSAMKGLTPDLPIYYDMEDDSTLGAKDRFADIAQTFCSKIEAAGYDAGVYASARWWKYYLTSPVFDSWSKWSAQCYKICEYPSDPDAWQYTSQGKVPGISGNVDVNYAYEGLMCGLSCAESLALEHLGDLPDGTYRLNPVLSNSVTAEIAGASISNGAVARIWEINGTDAQLWRVSHDAKGFVVLTNAASGKVLDVPSGMASRGIGLQQYESNGTIAQRWIAVKAADESIELLSAIDPNMAIELPGASTASGSHIALYSRNGTMAQRWTMIPDVTALESLQALAVAHADDLPDGTYAFAAGGSRNVLEIAGASNSNGASARLWDSNATQAQRWKVSHDDQGFVTLKNVASGKMLDVSGGSSYAGSRVQQYTSNGTYAQKWVAISLGNGSYKFVSALKKDLVLDASGGVYSGASAQLYSQNGTAAQSWHAYTGGVAVAPCEDSIPDGYYRLSPSCSASGRVIDVAGGSRANGADVQLYSANGSAAQLFYLQYSDGYYHIVNVRSGKSLDVANGDIVAGTRVQQWEPGKANPNQLWSATPNGDGTWSFINKGTGLALDVAGAADADSVRLNAYSSNGSTAQRFRLDRQDDLIPEGAYELSLASSSNMVVDVASAATYDGAPLQLYSRNNTFAQLWYVSKADGKSNTYYIESINSSKVMTLQSSGRVVQASKSNNSNQQWVPSFVNGYVRWTNCRFPDQTLTASGVKAGAVLQGAHSSNDKYQLFDLNLSTTVLPDGVYSIRLTANPDVAIDVSGASTSNGANVQIWASNNSGAQKWTFSRQSDGTYTVMNSRSHKMLDLAGGNAASGANVQLWEGWNTKGQRWVVSYKAGGWQIASAVNPAYVLDVNGGSTTNGTNVQCQKSNGTSAQRFLLQKTTYVQEYIGYQNPAQFYQVSHNSVNTPHLGEGIFGYRTPSAIPFDATRSDCVNAMITTAIRYVGTTPYVWDYSCAPGIGVDCSGLVMQALYATGMDLSPMNPWDHYYTPGHDQYANDIRNNPRFAKVSFSDRQPGDLILTKGHVSIYIGGDRIIEAYSPRIGVRYASVYSSTPILAVARPFV